jgi:hypothetical protein
MEDAEVPTRDVSNELCRRARSGDENADELYVSGVLKGSWPPGRSSMAVGAPRIVEASLLSEDFVSDEDLGSS